MASRQEWIFLHKADIHHQPQVRLILDACSKSQINPLKRVLLLNT